MKKGDGMDAAKRIYCTYCSARKRKDPGEIPAVERYESERIRRVHQKARDAGADFLILSGEYGLLEPAAPIPYYDHLLKSDEAAALAARVASQLRAQKISEFVFFSLPPESFAELRPYHAVIKTACASLGIPLRVEMFFEKD